MEIRSQQREETKGNYRITTHETEIRILVLAPSTVAFAVAHVA